MKGINLRHQSSFQQFWQKFSWDYGGIYLVILEQVLGDSEQKNFFFNFEQVLWRTAKKAEELALKMVE